MATLKTFDFMATVGNILKLFSKNANVKLEDIEIDDYNNEIIVDVYFRNSDTARQDFFGFFESIGYTVSEMDGCTDEDYYDIEDYPNGAIVIPESLTLKFLAEVDEVIYKMDYWDIKAK